MCLELQVAYGAGTLIQLLLGSGAHNYLEFKLVQGRCGGFWLLVENMTSYVAMRVAR